MTHVGPSGVDCSPAIMLLRRIAIRQGSLRSSFVWLPTIVYLHISCWAATPFSTLAKPRQPVQPMQAAGETLASRQTSTLRGPCLLCDSEFQMVSGRRQLRSLPSCSRATATTRSGWNPNFFCSSLSGAEAPNVCMPMTRPDVPT
jgi:hypothetical protein